MKISTADGEYLKNGMRKIKNTDPEPEAGTSSKSVI